MPKKSRGHGWSRHTTSSTFARGEGAAQEGPEVPVDGEQTAANAEGHAEGQQRTFLSYARDLWRWDYSSLLDEEDVGSRALVGSLPVSTYRQRLNNKPEAAARYDARAVKRARGAMAQLGRVSNNRNWTFSIVARSLSYFNQRVPVRVWRDEQEDRRIASRSHCILLLKEMHRLEPRPQWLPHEHVFVLAADQTYCWQGCKKRGGRRHGAERVDATGMPVRIRSEVYVNSLCAPVPFALCDFTAAELALVQQHGPYTGDFAAILPELNPVKVRHHLLQFERELGSLVLTRARDDGIPVQQLPLGSIMHALLARPDIDPGGPTFFDWLPPLKRCDTKSHQDMRRIIAHGWEHCGLPSPAVQVLYGDGQTVMRARDAKRRWPWQNRGVLVAVGNFHPHAHFMFGLIEAWWECIIGAFAALLSKDKVTPFMKDLEHANYVHAFTILRVMHVGIMAFLLQDVRDPPPDLLLRDPDAYAARVEHAGGVVLLHFLRYVGSPSLWWQRAARAGDGERAGALHAYSLHVFRAGTHKPNCAQVSIIALLSFFATHPKLANVVYAFSSVSLLGKPGCGQWIDRLLEYVNFLQQKRMNAYSGFDTALHHTSLLKAMLHVDHAWEHAVHGAGPTEEPMTLSMVYEARVRSHPCPSLLRHVSPMRRIPLLTRNSVFRCGRRFKTFARANAAQT
jgi:hypothetical protein